MTRDDARALRAAVAAILDPLYAGRSGNLPAGTAVTQAIARLVALDEALRDVALGGQG